MKKLLALALALIMVLAAVPALADSYKIAFSQIGQESDWRTANTDSINKWVGEHEGWEYIYDDAPSSDNFLFFGEDVLKAYDLLEKRIVHVHMKDIAYAPLRGEAGKTAITGKKLYPAPVGSGELPMAEIVRRLYERGYNGIYAFEHFNAGDQLLFMRRSARWLNNIFR